MKTFVPYGEFIEEDGKVLCGLCGRWLAAISGPHLRKHGTTAEAYRRQFGLKRQQRLCASTVADRRRANCILVRATNADFQRGAAAGVARARSGDLPRLGSAASKGGARPQQARFASEVIARAREARVEQFRQKREAAARALGFETLEAFYRDRRGRGLSMAKIAPELGTNPTVVMNDLRRLGLPGSLPRTTA